jgi:hypothetical protein
MSERVTERTQLGPLRALPTARHARVEHGNRLSPMQYAQLCAWTAVVEAPHAALRSSSHASMKAENWFQLRIVGVTAIREPGFGRACAGYYRRAPEVISRLKDTANEHVP